MAKAVRKDNKGRPLHKGEYYSREKKRYCYSYYPTPNHRAYVYARDLGDLREKEKLIQRDILDGLDRSKLMTTDLNSIFDRYMRTKTNLRNSTRANYLFSYNRYVRGEFGKRRICDIKYSDVLLFYKSLIEAGLKVSTVENVHSTVHPSFQMAVRDNLIRTNPSDGVVGEIKKSYKGQKDKRHALTYEQQMLFLNYLDGAERYKRWKPLLVFMFGTGVRIGEALAVKWSDIDFENNTIFIHHSLAYRPDCNNNFKNRFSCSEPKTKNSIRTIPMLDKVREALLEEKRYQEESKNHNIMKVDGVSGFLFVGKGGSFHTPSRVNETIKILTCGANYKEEQLAKKEGRQPIVIPDFSAHVIRHTFCTRLCEAETNIKVIQTIMGHSDIQTTLDIYAEVSENKKQEVFKDLNTKKII